MIIRLMIFGVAALTFSISASAQHADIRFAYEANVVVVRGGIDGNTDGLQIFEGTFPVRGFSDRFTENPGFLAEIANGDMVLPGDGVEIEILESQTFESYLTYFDPQTNTLSPTDATITIDDNAGNNTSDIVIANLEITGDNPQFIQTASNAGEVHSHIDFSLSDESPVGAYGFLFSLLPTDVMIEPSQPIWLVFNFGMSPSEFDEFAIPAFIGSDILLGDVNRDGVVNLLDVGPFVDLLTGGGMFLPEADINGDGMVDLLDVGPFVDILTG